MYVDDIHKSTHMLESDTELMFAYPPAVMVHVLVILCPGADLLRWKPPWACQIK